MIVWTVNNYIVFIDFQQKIYFINEILSRSCFVRNLIYRTNLFYDLVSSKFIVIPTIIFTIKREEVLILRISNMPKLLVLSHVILDYIRNFIYLFQIPGNEYIIDIFSDVILPLPD